MEYCNKCGRQLSDEDVYCPQCGKRNSAVPDGKEPDLRPALNVMAIVGMALSVGGMSALAGLIVSIKAYKRALAGEFRNPLTGLAKAGIITGAIVTAFYMLFFVFYIGYMFFFIRQFGGGTLFDGMSSVCLFPFN